MLSMRTLRPYRLNNHCHPPSVRILSGPSPSDRSLRARQSARIEWDSSSNNENKSDVNRNHRACAFLLAYKCTRAKALSHSAANVRRRRESGGTDFSFSAFGLRHENTRTGRTSYCRRSAYSFLCPCRERDNCLFHVGRSDRTTPLRRSVEKSGRQDINDFRF